MLSNNRGFSLPAILCTLFVSVASWAGQDNIRFKRYSLEQGLSQEAVFAMVQDRHGYLWFATQEGLNRFDGYEFKVYHHDPQNPHSLSHDAIYTLIEDSRGYLWLGTDGGGLDRFDPVTESFKHYRVDSHGLSSNRVNVVYEDQSGAIWIGTDGGGLNRLNVETDTVAVYRYGDGSGINHDNIRSLIQDGQGKLWVGSDAGLNRLSLDGSTFEDFRHGVEGLNNHSIRALGFDEHGRLWAGSYNNGLIRLDGQEGFEHFVHDASDSSSLCHNRVRDILTDKDGLLWIATDAGLCLWQQEQGFLGFKHNAQDLYSIGDNRTLSLYQDRGGVLWLGTFGGLNKWTSSNFEHYRQQPNQADGLSSNIITAFTQSHDRQVWVGTYNGLNRYNPDTGDLHQVSVDLKDKRIMSLYATDNDELWIGTRGKGLSRYNWSTGELVHYQHRPGDPTSLSGNGVTDIFEDSDGTLWVAVYGGGLNRFNAELGVFSHYRHEEHNPNSLSSDRIVQIYQTADGEIWLGTEGGGLVRFSPESEKFTRFVHHPDNPNSIGNNVAWSILEDDKGDLWIGTWGGGLNRWRYRDRKAGIVRFDKFGKSQGLPSNTLYDIVADKQGYLWLSSNQGLVRFHPQSHQIKHYDSSYGLQDNEFNLNAALATSSGQLLFGGSNGFNGFYPALLLGNTHKPPVVLTGIQKINKQTGTVDIDIAPLSIEFGYQDYAVSFAFAALDFTASEKNRYMYKLEGFDSDWVDIGNKRSTTFTNLPADDYVFRVKAANNDGVWNEQGMAIQVKVTPAPWRTWWAYTLYTLLVAASIFVYLRAHHRKLQEKARYSVHLEQQVALRTAELTDANAALEVAKQSAEAGDRAKGTFIATMSHELRTPMTSIIGFAETLLEDKVDEQERRRRVGKIVRNGKHLLQLMNDVLDISKIEVGKLEVEHIPLNPCFVLKELQELIGQQAQHKQLSFDIDLRYPLPKEIQGDPTRLKQILLNLCNNAIKFTDKGGISIKVYADNDINKLYFAVADTGIGIEHSKIDKVFDAFSQADSSTTRKYGGTGLGLSISKQLAEAMGGAMSLASEPGEGSVFSFSVDMGLPKPGQWLENDEQVQQMYRHNGVDSFVVPALRGRILLAEDWQDNQELIRMYIERSGAEVVIAENGRQAVEMALVDNFDMILMDVQMPEVDGIEATEVLRATGFSKPIIALTANVSSAEVAQYLACGFDGHLGKPIEREAFYLTLAETLAPGESLSETQLQVQDAQYQVLVAGFIERLPGLISAIDKAAEQQAWPKLSRLLHNLKGLGGSFGYQVLSELAEPMFQALSEGRPNKALQQLPQLKLAAAGITNNNMM